MKLWIRWGSLNDFKRLHDSNELLQSVLTNETGIRWSFESEFKEEVEKMLEGRVKFEMV